MRRVFSLLMLASVVMASRWTSGEEPQPTPASPPTAPNNLLDLPRKVACPAFNMGQWGGSPYIWYAPFCDPDSGAVALTLPPSAEACACEGGSCVGGLFCSDKTKQPISDRLGLNIHCDLLDGYDGYYVDPNAEFKPAVLDATRVEVGDKWIVRFKDKEDRVRYGGVLRIRLDGHVARLPLARVFSPDAETSEQISSATIPYQVVDSESLIAFQVNAPGSDWRVVESKYTEKLQDVNVYRVLFQPESEERPLQADILMRKPQ